MHFEILVEDASGRIALEFMMCKMFGAHGNLHTYRIHAYKGIGRLPRNLRGTSDPQKRVLLDRLPKLLAGYGTSLRHQDAAVVVVVDLDDRNCKTFKRELLGMLDRCNPRPMTLFRIAIEEGEAWLLGDKKAITTAYPHAKEKALHAYVQDSICGTWEKLADAIFPGGSPALMKLGWPHIGQVKCEWATTIAPHLQIDENSSRSFQVFREGLRKLAGIVP